MVCHAVNEQFELLANGLNWLAKKDGAAKLRMSFSVKPRVSSLITYKYMYM